MATHELTLNTPPLEIKRSDVSLSVRKDGAKLGELRVSNGSAVWFPANNSYGYKLSWSRVAELFEAHGKQKAEKK